MIPTLAFKLISEAGNGKTVSLEKRKETMLTGQKTAAVPSRPPDVDAAKRENRRATERRGEASPTLFHASLIPQQPHPRPRAAAAAEADGRGERRVMERNKQTSSLSCKATRL